MPVTTSSKTILITGCSKGFGFLFARDLARAGFTIIATSRSLSRMDGLKQLAFSEKLPIHCYELDVTNADQVMSCFATIIRDHGHLDVLINNAGYGLFAFIEHATYQEMHDQFQTNVFGLISVTQAVIPYMRKQGSGHIINVSSAAAGGVTPGMGFYAASKWAVEALSEAMFLELKSSGIKVSLLQPGPFHTAFGESARHNKKTELVERIGSGKRLQDTFIKDPQEVSDLLVKIVKSKRPRLRYPAGRVAKLIFLLRKILPGEWFIALEEKLLSINKKVLSEE